MYILKTESGREVQQNPNIVLKPRVRQILILADGTHSRGYIEDLLDHDIGAELYWLIQSGFVEEQVHLRCIVNYSGLLIEPIQQSQFIGATSVATSTR